jgi:hypothetical protein
VNPQFEVKEYGVNDEEDPIEPENSLPSLVCFWVAFIYLL